MTPDGDLVLLPATGGSIGLVGTGPDQPIRLRSVQVAGDGLELAGTADLDGASQPAGPSEAGAGESSGSILART